MGSSCARTRSRPDQVAQELHLTLEEVLEALQAGRAYGAKSLDTPLGDDSDGATLADVIGGDDLRLERAERIAALSGLRRLLTDEEREVLRLRFVEDLTQTQIAARIGCSQMQISRILRRTLDRLSQGAEAGERLEPAGAR
jgi:RNA polymerase sigma-B factor